MNNSLPDYITKRVIGMLIEFFSWAIPLGILYFGRLTSNYESQYNAGERLVLGQIDQTSNSWLNPIDFYLDNTFGIGSSLDFIWMMVSIVVVAETIKYFIKAELFNDDALAGNLPELKEALKELVDEDTNEEEVKAVEEKIYWKEIRLILIKSVIVGCALVCSITGLFIV